MAEQESEKIARLHRCTNTIFARAIISECQSFILSRGTISGARDDCNRSEAQTELRYKAIDQWEGMGEWRIGGHGGDPK
jgi:hypothetical protein